MSALHFVLSAVACGMTLYGHYKEWAVVLWAATAMVAQFRLIRYIKKYGYLKHD